MGTWVNYTYKGSTCNIYYFKCINNYFKNNSSYRTGSVHYIIAAQNLADLG